jgi:hypothetical protein
MWFGKSRKYRLMKARLTGDISQEEEEELSRILSNSPEDREKLRQLSALEEDLRRARPADVQADLTDRIMEAVSPAKRHKKSYLPDNQVLVNLFSPFPIHYAVLLFIGLVVGSAVTWTVMPGKSEIDESSVSGSISAKTVPGMSFFDPQFRLRMVPFRVDDLYYLNFVAESNEDTEIEILFNDTELSVIKAEYLTNTGNSGFSMGNGSVIFNSSGTTNFQLILQKPSGNPSRITITGRMNKNTLTTKQLFLE